MMIETINQNQHQDYPRKSQEAVRQLFPILCFTPDRTEAFIQAFEGTILLADNSEHELRMRINEKPP